MMWMVLIKYLVYKLLCLYLNDFIPFPVRLSLIRSIESYKLFHARDKMDIANISLSLVLLFIEVLIFLYSKTNNLF